MFIVRAGFKVFNEYDLLAILNDRSLRLQEKVKSLVNAGRAKEIFEIAEKHKITMFHFDIQNLTVETKKSDIPAEFFSNSFLVQSGRKYQKDVLIFRLPFTGDQDMLHCRPSTHILWTEEIAIEGNDIVF
ncbi:hypothetical protein D4R87_03010, partial [bacterium]